MGEVLIHVAPPLAMRINSGNLKRIAPASADSGTVTRVRRKVRRGQDSFSKSPDPVLSHIVLQRPGYFFPATQYRCLFDRMNNSPLLIAGVAAKVSLSSVNWLTARDSYVSPAFSTCASPLLVT